MAAAAAAAHFLTVATKSALYFPYLLQSCARHEVPLRVLGWGDHYGSHIVKLRLIMEYIASLPDDDIVCYFDAYDVIVAQHKNEILSRFESLTRASGKGFVVSTEFVKYPTPLHRFIAKQYYPKCLNENMNLGTFMGYVRELKHIFGLIGERTDQFRTPANDQREFLRLCNKQTDLFATHVLPDRESRIFYVWTNCAFFAKNREYDLNQYIAQHKRTQPCIIHCPNRTIMTPLVRYLGYTIRDEEAEELKAQLNAAINRTNKSLILQYAWWVAGVIGAVAVVWVVLRGYGRGRRGLGRRK